MEQQRRLHRDGFSEEEAQQIVRRAVELQQESESPNTIPRSALEAGAESAGVRPEFVQQAIDEMQLAATTARSAGRTVERPARSLLVAAGIAFLVAFILAFVVYFLSAAPAPMMPPAPPRAVREVPAQPYPPARPAPSPRPDRR